MCNIVVLYDLMVEESNKTTSNAFLWGRQADKFYIV